MILLLVCMGLLVGASSVRAQQVVGFAKLAASTFEPGPTSGQFLDAPDEAPFAHVQPVQGFSAVMHGNDDTLFVMADNGFGARENSADHLLRLFEVRPDFASGNVEVLRSIPLCDPEHRVPFAVVADGAFYPASAIAVDDAIREGRLLTGWDFDPESCQRAVDGTFWVGDEFGPFLLHFDVDGTLLEAPFALEGVHSPQNLLEDPNTANAQASGGFEGLALSADGAVLYALMEKSLRGEMPGQLAIYRFDLSERAFDPLAPYRVYPLDAADHHIGDFATLDASRFLVIERDDFEGRQARFKKIFLVDFDLRDDEGRLRKREIVDLLHIADPKRRAGPEAMFGMPLVTLEGLLVFDERTLCVVNDNNFPFSVGRHVDTGAPDDDEFVLIGFERPLTALGIFTP